MTNKQELDLLKVYLKTLIDNWNEDAIYFEGIRLTSYEEGCSDTLTRCAQKLEELIEHVGEINEY